MQKCGFGSDVLSGTTGNVSILGWNDSILLMERRVR